MWIYSIPITLLLAILVASAPTDLTEGLEDLSAANITIGEVPVQRNLVKRSPIPPFDPISKTIKKTAKLTALKTAKLAALSPLALKLLKKPLLKKPFKKPFKCCSLIG